MDYVVCRDDGERDLKIPPYVIHEKKDYFIELNDFDFVIDIVDAENASDAEIQVSETKDIPLDELVSYTLDECKTL